MMTEITDRAEYLSGQMLIAMPGMPDPRFAKSVIYLCAHNEEGAMGLVVNRPMDSLTFPDLLEQLEIETPSPEDQIRVLEGGPVEAARGFVLHSADYLQEATMLVNDEVGLTATIEILHAIATGEGPQKCLLALGYAGWGPGQLDAEIKENGWLHVEADASLLFEGELDAKWQRAMEKIGIDPRMLSDEAGHA
jgi:putative transcriptional regulator